MKLLWLVLLVAAAPALATEVRVDGSYRLRLASDTNLVLDDAGTALGQSHWAEHRLRITPKIVEGSVLEIQGSFDVVSGLLGGDVANDFRGFGWQGRSDPHGGLHAGGFDFRHFFLELKLPVGLLQLGQMPSHWGMGLVAHGGNGEEESDFGDVRFGDIVDRLLFATRPLVALLGPRSFLAQHLALALAGDLVYRDRYAQLIQSAPGNSLRIGDKAAQFVAAALFDPSEATRVGFYTARRVQAFALDGGDLHIWVFDAHARTLFQPESLPLTFSLEAEAAQIYGGTSHAPSLNAPGTSRVNQQGAVVRGLISNGPLEAELEGGYASGRANPFDDQVTAFQMNRDFKVGLVLWDEVMQFQTQNAARRLSDPALLGRPPPGLDLLPTEGAVTNALYLKPTLRYRPALLGGKLRAVASVLFARAPEPVIDLYQALVSSAPRNSFGAVAKRSYGTEVDGALGYRTRLATELGVEAGVQAGYLFPGDAFDRADGTRMPGAFSGKLRGTLIF